MKYNFETTLERDIDLMIIEEFLADADFASIFTSAVGIYGDYTVEEVFHSKFDSTLGESDIVFILKIKGRRHAIHIEDKINAQAMPSQYERYVKRAEKDISLGKYESYSIVITAPENYLLSNAEAQKYPNHISYEKLLSYFCNKSGSRATLKAYQLVQALNTQKHSSGASVKEHVIKFRTEMNSYQQTLYPALPLGSIAEWCTFHTPESGTEIIYKADRGFCDYTYNRFSVEELTQHVSSILEPDMQIVKTGKSAAVRIIVPPVNYYNSFSEELDNVKAALCAINRLYNISIHFTESAVLQGR